MSSSGGSKEPVIFFFRCFRRTFSPQYFFYASESPAYRTEMPYVRMDEVVARQTAFQQPPLHVISPENSQELESRVFFTRGSGAGWPEEVLRWMNTEEFVGLYIFHTFPVYKEWGLIPIFNVVGVKFNDSSKRRTRWGSVSGIVVIKAELKSMKSILA